MSTSKSKSSDYTWCFTGSEPDKTTVFNWKIDNYLSRITESSQEYLLSDSFSINDQTFKLKLHSKGKQIGEREYIGISLAHISTKGFPNNYPRYGQLLNNSNPFDQNNKEEVTVSCTFVLSSNEIQLAEAILDHKPPKYGFPNLVSHDVLKETLKREKDQLNVSATLTLHRKDTQRSSKHSLDKGKDDDAAIREVGKNIWNAYETKIFCDFTLISKDQKSFPCHQIILASRSPVMKRMLNSGMKEAKKKQLQIKNYDSELLSVILEFMYKGVIGPGNLKTIADELFNAADYYEMTTMKKIAELALIEQMDSENMLRMFLMADMHDAKEMRIASMKLIVENSFELVNGGDWKQVIAESHNPDLVFEILEGMAHSQRPEKRAKLHHQSPW